MRFVGSLGKTAGIACTKSLRLKQSAMLEGKKEGQYDWSTGREEKVS